jgi:energy-coupling factor transporter transmembrane protein EcfT
MNDFFTWGLLSSYSGAILAVTLITQFIKGIGFIDKIPTRFVSWIVAVIVLILAQLFTQQLTLSSGILTLLNAVVVSLAANGTYDAINAVARDK